MVCGGVGGLGADVELRGVGGLGAGDGLQEAVEVGRGPVDRVRIAFGYDGPFEDVGPDAVLFEEPPHPGGFCLLQRGHHLFVEHCRDPLFPEVRIDFRRILPLQQPGGPVQGYRLQPLPHRHLIVYRPSWNEALPRLRLHAALLLRLHSSVLPDGR